jgi:hypothetical protein
MEKIKMFFRAVWAHKIFKIIKWAFLILFGLYLILIAFRVVQLFNIDKINVQVEKIHNTKLTLDDVMGKNLPPDPGVLADTMVQGIDANNNGIRDDVELAVFKEYPNSAKTRAVLLQYALVLQMQLTLPLLTTETATALIEDNDSRANVCLWNLSSRSNMKKFLADMKKYESFIEQLQFNNEQRKKAQENFYEYVRSYSMSNDGCDLDLSTLPN